MSTKYSDNYNHTTSFTDVCARFALTASVELTWTVPGSSTDKYQADFSYASNSNVFVGLNTAATVPAANNVQTTQTIEFRPKKRYVAGGDVVRIITPDATAYCGVSLRNLISG